MCLTKQYVLISDKKEFSKHKQLVMDNQFEETSYTDEEREFGKTIKNNIEAIRTDPSERAGVASGTSEATPFISPEMRALNLSTVSSPYESHLQTGDYQIITNLFLRY